MTLPTDTINQPQTGGVAIWTYYEDTEPNHALGTFAARGGLFLVGGENHRVKNHYAHQLAYELAKFSPELIKSDEENQTVYVPKFETNLRGEFFLPYENDPAKTAEQNAAFRAQHLNETVHTILGKKQRVVVIENISNKFMADVALTLANHALNVFATVDTDVKENLVASFNSHLIDGLETYDAIAMPILAAFYNVIETPEKETLVGAYQGYGFLTVPVEVN